MAEDFVSRPRTRPRTWDPNKNKIVRPRTRTRTWTQIFPKALRGRRQVFEDTLLGHDLDFLGSRDVIGHVTIRLAVGDFLWVVHCDHTSI